MNCRIDESCKFKRKLTFRPFHVINTKQQTITRSIKDAFEGENMQSEHYVLGYRIDIYFHDYRLPIDIDEFGRCDRNSDYEKIEKKD